MVPRRVGASPRHSIRVTRKLDEVQSPFQKIEIYESTDWGNVMLIDGAMMVTTRDAHGGEILPRTVRVQRRPARRSAVRRRHLGAAIGIAAGAARPHPGHPRRDGQGRL